MHGRRVFGHGGRKGGIFGKSHGHKSYASKAHSYKKCKSIPREQCRKVSIKVPRQACRSVPMPVCKLVPRQVCNAVPATLLRHLQAPARECARMCLRHRPQAGRRAEVRRDPVPGAIAPTSTPTLLSP